MTNTGLSGRLEWLNLKGCNELNTRGLVALATFQRLRYLDCSATGVVGLAPLSKCTSLNRLRLSGCERLADGALRGLEGLPNLADLDLSGNSSLVTPVLLDDLLTLPGQPLVNPYYKIHSRDNGAQTGEIALVHQLCAIV